MSMWVSPGTQSCCLSFSSPCLLCPPSLPGPGPKIRYACPSLAQVAAQLPWARGVTPAWSLLPQSWRWPRPGTSWMLFCSVFWRRVTWTGSVWMRRPGRPLQTPTTRTAPSRPLANGKGAGAQPAERPPDPALVLIFSLPHRPSARFPHQRRKKRREMDDGLAEGGPQRSNAYVIKLFDRSVDLAQFSENTPLYPICRAWMRNSPSVRERERSPSSPLPPLPEDEEGSEVTNSKSRDVYKLPPPTAPGPPGDTCRSRIPSPLQPETQGAPDDEPSEPEPSPSTLIYRNMQRWKRIRQRWKEASHRNQLRYSESMKILREMYERQ
uniref:Lin-37 DREAM MuvB core complex component n=2 Tax=Sus scrofa TaxID=9823 RepID=A0A8D1LLR6_PIG